MEVIVDRSATAKRSLEGQGQSSQFWLLGETVDYIWKHSVTTINEQLGLEFWNRFRKIAEDVGCKVSVHNRKSLKNVHGGWGHYSLTIMGRHRSHLYKQLCDHLQDAGGGLGVLQVAWTLRQRREPHPPESEEQDRKSTTPINVRWVFVPCALPWTVAINT